MRGVIFGLAVAATIASVPAGTPDLSGVWRPDPAVSRIEKVLKEYVDPAMGTAPPPPPSGQPIHPIERIEQEGSKIRVSSLDESGTVISTLELTADGSPTVNRLPGGQVVHRARTRWKDSALHVEWSMERGGQKFIWGRDVRSLSDSGATQRLERDVEDAKSKTHVVVVLRRDRRAAAAPGAHGSGACESDRGRPFSAPADRLVQEASR